MPVAISLDETKDYVLKVECEKNGDPKPSATVFVLGVMDQIKLASVSILTRKIAKDDNAFERYVRDTLRYGLKGWRNFTDKTGRLVTFETDDNGTPTDATLSKIPATHLIELAVEIIRYNSMTGQELGN